MMLLHTRLTVEAQNGGLPSNICVLVASVSARRHRSSSSVIRGFNDMNVTDCFDCESSKIAVNTNDTNLLYLHDICISCILYMHICICSITSLKMYRTIFYKLNTQATAGNLKMLTTTATTTFSFCFNWPSFS